MLRRPENTGEAGPGGLFRSSPVSPCRISGPAVSDLQSFPKNVEIHSVKSSSSSILVTNLFQNTLGAKENTCVDCAPIHVLCSAHKEAPRPPVDPDSETQGFKSLVEFLQLQNMNIENAFVQNKLSHVCTFTIQFLNLWQKFLLTKLGENSKSTYNFQ